MEKREEEEKKQVLEPINSGSHGDTLIFSIWDFGGFGGFYLMIFLFVFARQKPVSNKDLYPLWKLKGCSVNIKTDWFDLISTSTLRRRR